MHKSKRMRKIIKSAKMGKPYAMYQLGICYQLGKESELDLNKAAMWMQVAAEAGYEPAIQWLKDYYFDDNAAIQAAS